MANGGFDPNALITLPPDFFSGPQNLTSTTVSDLPDWLKPYVTGMLDRASKLSQEPYPYPDQRVAAFTPAQQVGQAETLGYAQGSQPMVNLANAVGMDTLGGAYLSPETNPYLKETFDQASRGVVDQYKYATAPTTAANFARAGAFGGSAMDQTQQMQQFGLGENLTSLANQIFGGNYQTERQRQYGQQSYTPTILNQQYIGPQQEMNVGAAQQAQTQNVLNTGYQNQYNRANWPFQALQMMEGAIGAVPGGAGSTTSTYPNPNYASPFASLVGLGMLNAGGGGGFGGSNFAFPGVTPGAAAGFSPFSGF